MLQLTIMLFLGAAVNAASLNFNSLHSARGFSWQSDRSPGFDIYFEPGSTAEREIEKIKQVMEDSRAHINDMLGAKSEVRIPVFLVESRQRMKALTGEESNGLAANGVEAAVYSDTVKAIGAHETCHILARAAWGSAHGSWIAEGLAVFSDDAWGGVPLHSVARALMDRKKLAPMKDLVRGGWNRKYGDVITYPELGSFVKFVYEKHGRDL